MGIGRKVVRGERLAVILQQRPAGERRREGERRRRKRVNKKGRRVGEIRRSTWGGCTTTCGGAIE